MMKLFRNGDSTVLPSDNGTESSEDLPRHDRAGTSRPDSSHGSGGPARRDGKGNGPTSGSRRTTYVQEGSGRSTPAERNNGSAAGSSPASDPVREVLRRVDTTNGNGDGNQENWVEKTEKAVARARAAGTSTAWQEASRAASVVSDMAQTMQVLTHVQQIAENMDRLAAGAVQKADTAGDAAAEAMRSADQAAVAAKEAAKKAQAAARAEAEAKQKAEQLARVAPEAADSARAANDAAAAAKVTAQRFDEIVAKAHEANTPDAWSKALKLASEAWARENVDGSTPDVQPAKV
jgi:hypothetical protein